MNVEGKERKKKPRTPNEPISRGRRGRSDHGAKGRERKGIVIDNRGRFVPWHCTDLSKGRCLDLYGEEIWLMVSKVARMEVGVGGEEWSVCVKMKENREKEKERESC